MNNKYLSLLDHIIKINEEMLKKEKQLKNNPLYIAHLAAIDDVLSIMKPILTDLYRRIDELEKK